ncbi:hypothetical protein [Methylocystis sp.]|uniref:hypothetical protein n=1 Tax=Methylocystis sp. TaxID=1911079 RepID=UPI003DA3B7E5
MSDIYEDLLNRHRWVRVMADYSCDGVWDIEGNSCGVEELPISPALVERLGRWQAQYEAIEDALDEENRLRRESDWTNFSAEGLAIARAVKAELPGWTVFYFDEARACVAYLDGKRQRPSAVEYEILLDDKSGD